MTLGKLLFYSDDVILFSPDAAFLLAFHISKSRPYDADQAWRDHLERVAKRDPYSPTIFHTTYPFSRYPLYLVYSKRPVPAREYDPHRAYLDWFDRMNEFDKLFPSLSPVSRLLSPTPIKVKTISYI